LSGHFRETLTDIVKIKVIDSGAQGRDALRICPTRKNLGNAFDCVGGITVVCAELSSPGSLHGAAWPASSCEP
jgi:hypothetical protein